MKRRLLLLILPFVVVLSTMLPYFPAPTVSADTASDAAAFCKGAEVQWYNKPADPQNGHYESCVGGYSQEKKGTTQTEAQYCNRTAVSEPSACSDGWTGAKNGQTTAPAATFACDAYPGPKNAPCKAALAAQCEGWINSTSPIGLTACLHGVFQQAGGGGNDCSSTYKAGDGLKACNNGYSSTPKPVPADNNQQLDCESSFDNPLTWIICPIINTMVSAITVVDNIITAQLSIQTSSIFCGSDSGTCGAYFAAWQSFRNIALGLMAIAGLIILIAQALGLELLDAYMIRKTLPRLLIAAIGITLSWPLMQFFVNLSNDLGFGIRHLIYAPFDKLKDGTDLSFGSGIANIFFGTAAVGVGALPIWIAAGGIGVLLSYVGTAALAVFIAIIVLILRQVAIILLIILAPIAIVAYILPNTQNIYKIWWDSFAKALMMFPLIAAFIASGRVFSAVAINNAGNSGGANAVLSGFIGFAAYFAPYFLIPLTFKFAGGAIRQIGGFVNDRGRGGFDGLRKFRSNQSKSRIDRARSGGLYRKDFGKFNRPFAKDENGNRKRSSIGNLLNTVGNYTLDADEAVPAKLGTTRLGGLLSEENAGLPGFRRGGARDMARIDQSRREQTAKALQEINPGYKAGRLLGGQFQYYKKDLSATDQATLDHDYGIKDENGNITSWRAPEGYGERKQVAQLFARSSSQEGREASEQLMGAAELLEKYPASAETERVDGRLLGLMASAREGRLDIDDVVSNHNARRTAGVGQAQAIQETNSLQELLAPKRVSAARGHGIEFDQNGQAFNVYKERKDAQGRVIGGGPFSQKTADSLARISAGDMGPIKSEDLDKEVGEAWVAQASTHKMTWGTPDPVTGERKVVVDKSSGDKVSKETVDIKAYERAQEMQKRLRYLAMYSQGDSDVGRKLAGIWKRIEPDTELKFGTDTDGHTQINNPEPPEPLQPA